MTTYVMVHGAWHAGWAWDKVAPVLRERGHEVLTPDLPSAPGTTLAEHVEAVRTAISSARSPVTVVAHSYAGVVVPEAVAATDPDLVEAVVLVDGWLAAAGGSLLDVAPDWFGDWVRSNATGQGEAAMLPAPPANLLGLEDTELVALVESRMTAQPLRTFTDKATLTLDHPRVARYAISCQPSLFPFADLARASGYEVHEIEADHEVMLSRPKELLELLAMFGARTS
jgi:pimeloyl-ACP methyl ester carboxylesterase